MTVLLEQDSASFRLAAWIDDPHTFVFVDQSQLFLELIEVFISSLYCQHFAIDSPIRAAGAGSWSEARLAAPDFPARPT
jgi:hypothetical protein